MEPAVKQAYKHQLIQAGVCSQRAAQVADTLSPAELQVITGIWSQWAATWDQLHQQAS
jgi:hypothetical protein